MQKLYTKLYAIQQLALAVSKDWKNPHFKSAYPTLDNVIEVLTPVLNKNWILVTHFAENDTFVTRVVDTESWEVLDSRYTMLGTTPQQRGSEQTYFRRYSMIALFNLPSEDDDGNIASNNAPRSSENSHQASEPTEWIDKAKIASLIEKLKTGELIASSGDEAVKIARQYFKVSKENAEIIKQEFSKHII